jgi:hypothetical protein
MPSGIVTRTGVSLHSHSKVLAVKLRLQEASRVTSLVDRLPAPGYSPHVNVYWPEIRTCFQPDLLFFTLLVSYPFVVLS